MNCRNQRKPTTSQTKTTRSTEQHNQHVTSTTKYTLHIHMITAKISNLCTSSDWEQRRIQAWEDQAASLPTDEKVGLVMAARSSLPSTRGWLSLNP